MRIARVVVVSVVVALFAAAPNAVANVCHPKKPITCHAAQLSTLSTGPAVSPAPAKVKATSVKDKSPVNIQQSMACGPWVRWMCAATSLS